MSYWFLPLVAAIANTVLAFLVVRMAPWSQRSRAFSLLTAAFVLWNLNFFVLFFVDDYETAVWWTRLLRTGAIFIPAATLYFVASLRERRARLWRVAHGLNLLCTLVLLGCNFLDLFVTDLQRFGFGYYSVAGPAYSGFAAHLMLNSLLALAVLVYDFRTTEDPRLRLELKFWLVGATVASALGATNFLPAYGIPVYPLGNLGSTAWVAIVGYAFARHRLMGVDVFVSKGAAFLLTAVIVIAPITLFLMLAHQALLGAVDADLAFVVVLALFAVAALFPVVQRIVEPSLHESLFPDRVAPRLALASFARSVTRILDRDRLVREVAAVLTRNFGVRSVLVALAEPSPSQFRIAYSVGGDAHAVHEASSAALRRFLLSLRGPVLRAEVESGAWPEATATVASLFRSNGWEVLVPFRVGPTLLGFLAIGAKSERSAFSVQDLQILEELGAEAAIALENARLYAEVQQSQAVLQRADRSSALGVLAAGIAHEIRNPLVSVQTFFQLAPTRLHDEEFVTSFLTTASGEVTRISRLINELLSFARSPSSEFAPTNLNEVVRGAFVLLAPEARQHGLSLSEQLDEGTPLVWANFEQIRQVVINLLFNAIQATARGGAVRVSTRRVRDHGREFGQVEVRDTGRGIPAAELDSIYHPFFTTKVSGTGLGLAIVQRIVNEHDGRISVTSEEGKGTCFFVDVPVYEPVPVALADR